MVPVTNSILSAVFGAVASALLAGILHTLVRLRRTGERFMTEHLWLLAMAQWSQQTIAEIARQLGIMTNPPPEWPGKKR